MCFDMYSEIGDLEDFRGIIQKLVETSHSQKIILFLQNPKGFRNLKKSHFFGSWAAFGSHPKVVSVTARPGPFRIHVQIEVYCNIERDMMDE